jgi:hypothetical protein
MPSPILSRLNLINKLQAAYQVCHECGIKYGEARSSVSTFWNGECDVCGENRGVTEARDYGYMWKGIRDLREEHQETMADTPKKDEMKYTSRVKQIEICRGDDYGALYTNVKIDDEGGGPFLIIEAEAGEVRLDFEEFDEVVKAVKILRDQFNQ